MTFERDHANYDRLLGLLRKLDSQNKMLETKTIHFGAGLDGIAAIRVADKRKTLGHACVPVLCQEHPRDTTKALEHVAKLSFLRHFRDLLRRGVICKWLVSGQVGRESRMFWGEDLRW